MLHKLIKRYSCVVTILIIGFTAYYFILTTKIQSLTAEQTSVLQKSITAVKLTGNTNSQKSLPCNEGDLARQALRSSLREAVFLGKVFDNLLVALGVTSDSYLMEIATRGVSAAKDLQREFFISLLPKLELKSSININNSIVSRFVHIRKKDVVVDNQIKNMVREVSVQNFDKVISIIDGLPDSLQLEVQTWRQKIMDYIYLQEFLKFYLGEQ